MNQQTLTKAKEILRRIAYPNRGSDDEHATLLDFAEEIQSEIPRHEIDDNYDPTPYCHHCGAHQRKYCHCPPPAENE